jgi:hypothetical protein
MPSKFGNVVLELIDRSGVGDSGGFEKIKSFLSSFPSLTLLIDPKRPISVKSSKELYFGLSSSKESCSAVTRSGGEEFKDNTSRPRRSLVTFQLQDRRGDVSTDIPSYSLKLLKELVDPANELFSFLPSMARRTEGNTPVNDAGDAFLTTRRRIVPRSDLEEHDEL